MVDLGNRADFSQEVMLGERGEKKACFDLPDYQEQQSLPARQWGALQVVERTGAWKHRRHQLDL